MKKLIFTFLLCISYSVIYSQLKVTPDGKVGIGITETPISKFAVGTIGETYSRNAFYTVSGEAVNMQIYGAGNSPYGYGDFGTALRVVQNVSSERGDYGIRVEAIKPAPTNNGRAVGVSGLAGNATPGYNWGVIGSLEGTNNGAGIFGAIGAGQGQRVDGRYAGYFLGDVKVTGTINGVIVGNSDIRYKKDIEQLDNEQVEENVLAKLMRLKPVSYKYKQLYTEPEYADTLQTRSSKGKQQGLYDEKSQMFKKKHFGLVAQDLQAVYPDLVYENDNGYLAINYTELIPLLIQSMKELKEKVDILSAFSSQPPTLRSSGTPAAVAGAVLYQNTPNDFTNATEIKFNLPENISDASVMVFDMQGALIKQVAVNSRQSAITLKGSELNAGMYLYSLLVNGEEVDTKRMILTH